MAAFARAAATFTTLLCIAILAVAPSGLTAQEAQDKDIDALLKQSHELIERGRDGEARDLLTPLLARPETPMKQLALGFFLRGVANDRLRQPAAALDDLGNAIWFQVLPEPLQAQAHMHRASALMQLGRVREAKEDAERAQALAPGNASIAQAVEAIRREPDEKSPNVPQTSAIVKSNDRITPQAEPPVKSPAGETTAALAQPDAKTGKFAIQLGAISSQSAAEAEWRRIQTAHPELLAGLESRYVQRGNLVKLQAGPLPSFKASAELCTKLQQRGQDCFALTP